MKKLLLFFALMAATAGTCTVAAIPDSIVPQPTLKPVSKNAVVYHHEIFVGYGLYGLNDMLVGFSAGLGTIFSLGRYVERNISRTGTIMVGYKYRFNRTISLGATYAYGSLRGESWGYTESDVPERRPLELLDDHYHTLNVECDFRYLTRKVVTLYSTVGLGISYFGRTTHPYDTLHEDVSRSSFLFPNFHLSAVGVKVGGYRAGGYAELGFGYKGILNIGAYVRF